MKLLFDQNLSPRLVDKLSAHFPASTHVFTIGLEKETDSNLWLFAEKNEYTIITKDSDFVELATQKGPPPNVIWLNIGNCSTKVILSTIELHIQDIKHFIESDDLDIYVIR